MNIGTKSILFGAHAFFLHPIFLFVAWWRLYGFPWDHRLWLAFFVHDLGYFGKPDMDGEEGETHPILGAQIMGAFYGQEWEEFCICHSRYFAKRKGLQTSRLCVADKLAVCLEPWFIYIPRVWLSGEIFEYCRLSADGNFTQGNEYMELAATGTGKAPKLSIRQFITWHKSIKVYLTGWVEAHKDGSPDSWTKQRN